MKQSARLTSGSCCSQPQSAPRRRTFTRIFCALISALLLLAACTKAIEIAGVAGAGAGSVVTLSWIMLVVIFELILAIWLAAGVYTRPLWFVTTGAFSVFFVVTGGMGLSMVETCGCFGAVRVNPWLTATVDLLILIGLISFRSSFFAAEVGPHRYLAWTVTLAAAGIVVASGGEWYRTRESAVNMSDYTGGGADISVVWIKAASLVNQPFQLERHIAIGGPSLSSGGWLVVIYRADCDGCRTAISWYASIATKVPEQRGRLALVEMPPFSDDQPWLPTRSAQVSHHRLTDRHRWFAQTPVVLLVQDGIIHDAADGEKARELHVNWDSMTLERYGQREAEGIAMSSP